MERINKIQKEQESDPNYFNKRLADLLETGIGADDPEFVEDFIMLSSIVSEFSEAQQRKMSRTDQIQLGYNLPAMEVISSLS